VADALSLPQRLAALLRPGDTIVIGNGSAEPDRIIGALIEVAGEFAEPVRVIQITTGSREALVGADVRGVRLLTPAPGPASRRAIEAGRADLLFGSVGQIARWIDDGSLAVDGVLLQAGPAEGGRAWPGLSLDLALPAFERARFRAIETNAALPRIASSHRLDLARCDIVLEVEEPPRAAPADGPDDVSARIGAGIGACLPDGATLELGIGRAAAGLPGALRGRRGFALHTGLITDDVRQLVEDGTVDRPPRADVGEAVVVGSVVRGSAGLYRWADRNPALLLVDARVSHNVALLAALHRFVAVNGALQVDLHGNANGLTVGGRLLGGLGGAIDYAAAGANASGSVIALESTTRDGGTRIVPQVDAVTIPGIYVTHLVTEHGAARLAGMSRGERTRAIIELAAPQHRDRLAAAARGLGLL